MSFMSVYKCVFRERQSVNEEIGKETKTECIERLRQIE